MTCKALTSKWKADIKNKEKFQEGIEETQKTIEKFNQQLPVDLSQEFMLYTINDMEETLEFDIPSVTFDAEEVLFYLNDNNTGNENQDNNQNENNGNQQDEQTKEEQSTNQEVAVKYTINTSIECTYGQLKELLAYLYERENGKRIVLNNLSLTSNPEEDALKASFSLSFYGLASPTRAPMSLDLGVHPVGKESVFMPFEGNGSQQVPSIRTEPQEEKADFFIMINPITSDNSTAIIGEMEDNKRLSYVYADNTGLVDGEIEFYQTGGNYYYRYKLGNQSNPNNYATGNQFDPEAVLEIEVYSSERYGDEDLSGINATIKNSTDKPVHVYYYSEDINDPRPKYYSNYRRCSNSLRGE